MDDRYCKQCQFGIIWWLEDLEVVFYLFSGDWERIRVDLYVAPRKPNYQFTDRSVEIMKLDIHAKVSRFAPFLSLSLRSHKPFSKRTFWPRLIKSCANTHN